MVEFLDPDFDDGFKKEPGNQRADAAILRAEMGGTPFTDPLALKATLTKAEVADGSAERLLACLPRLSSALAEPVASMFDTANVVSLAADILRTFPRVSDVNARWYLGAALLSGARKIPPKLAEELMPEWEALVVDRSFGRSRENLAEAFPKTRSESGKARALAILGSDPEIDGHLLDGLRSAKVMPPLEVLQALARDRRAWVRRTARGMITQ